MPRVNATVPPDAIRIEDEVWQEAFARREPGRSRSERGLQAVDKDRTSSTLEPHAWTAEPGGPPDRTAEPAGPPEPTAEPAGPPDRTAEPAGLPDRPAPSTIDPAPTASPPVGAPGATTSPTGPPTRRTVVIRGRGAEDYLPWPDASRRRPQRRAYERSGFRPDRLAMWAVLLGFVLVLVAILSSAH